MEFFNLHLNPFRVCLTEEKLGHIVQNLLLSVVKGLKQEGNPNREALMAYIRKEIQGASDKQALFGGRGIRKLEASTS